MPHYRISLQKNIADRTHRDPRSTESAYSVIVDADSIGAALIEAANNQQATDRVVAIEELAPTPVVTDEDIVQALTVTADEHDLMDLDEYEDDGVMYESPYFLDTCQDVAEALRSSGLTPGLTLSLVVPHTETGPDYVTIEVFDQATGTYRADGCQIKHMTTDRSAEGKAGVIAIAHAIIDVAQPLL